ncbi:hypothetical protein [Photorhabdus stackebrandtii]|uniref:hypothetical protein n=1 Tax=Photorhabdus stackebrandtii TaxID=1123042 RepID=UPI00140C0BB0|nr:hypothetical protein [Photorhabdus stackebrandtii]
MTILAGQTGLESALIKAITFECTLVWPVPVSESLSTDCVHIPVSARDLCPQFIDKNGLHQ